MSNQFYKSNIKNFTKSKLFQNIAAGTILVALIFIMTISGMRAWGNEITGNETKDKEFGLASNTGWNVVAINGESVNSNDIITADDLNNISKQGDIITFERANLFERITTDKVEIELSTCGYQPYETTLSNPSNAVLSQVSYSGLYDNQIYSGEYFTWFGVTLTGTQYFEYAGQTWDLAQIYINDDYAPNYGGHSRSGFSAIHCMDNGKPILKSAFSNYNIHMNSDPAAITPYIDGDGWLHFTICICLRDEYHLNVQDMGGFDIKVPPVNGGVQMDKRSKCEWAENNPNYSYKNGSCVYDIFSDAGCSQLVAQMTVDGNGHAQTDIHALKTGFYWVRENQNAHGTNYLWNGEVGTVYVNPNTLNWVNWPSSGSGTTRDTPVDDPVTIQIGKIDAQTGKSITEGEVPSFANAHYEYTYFPTLFTRVADAPENHERQWVMKTAENGKTCLTDGDNAKVSGDEFYRNEYGDVICPIGTYVIKEIKAPEGYELSNIVYIENVISDSKKEHGASSKAYYGIDCDTWCENKSGIMEKVHHTAGDEITLGTGEIIPDPQSGIPAIKAKEQVDKGDFQFDKAVRLPGEPQTRLTRIPFKVTSTTTREWHVVVTDNNAQVNSENTQCLHRTNTNYFDKLLDKDGNIPAGGIDEQIIDNFYNVSSNHAGVWFCWDKQTGKYVAPTEAADSLGAMPYDTYILEELPVSKTQDYLMIKQEFTIDTPNYNVDLGTLDNVLKPDISIETIATSSTGEKTIEISSNAVINDRVRYSGTAIQTGKTYHLKSWVVDAQTEKKVSDTVETIFKPASSEGYVDAKISLDTLGLVGKKLSCFEELYNEDGELVAQHKKVDDLYQAVSVSTPAIYTNLYEFGTHAKIIDGRSTDTELQDYVTYSGLTEGDSYQLKCNILDKTTKQVLAEANSTFVAQQKGSGTTDIYISLDTTPFLENHDLVAYEYIYKNDILIAQHTDINDSNQTVKIKVPTGLLLTYASDSLSSTSTIPISDNATVVDRVVYTGVEAGYAYKLKAQLMDKEIGQPLIISGAYVTGEKSFDVSGTGSKSGEETVSLNVDTRTIQGKNLVVFEKLYQVTAKGERLVASHENILDANQTVTVQEAKCETLLVDTVSGKKIVSRAEELSVTDTISYSGLVSGNTYTIESSIVEKSSKKTLGETSSTFVALSGSGDTSVSMIINTLSLEPDTQFVAYERILLNGVEICKHVDINDAKQTLTVADASIDTNLHLKQDYAHIIPRSHQVELTDGVDYIGLTSGQKYSIYGKLVDVSGNDFIDSAGNVIEYKGTFTADSSGKTSISYTLDTSDLSDGTKIISFVEVKVNDSIICAHKDITDENQTVMVTVSTIDIATSARGKISEQKEIYCVDDESIIDSVSYHGAEPGYEYKLRARLIDKSTTKAVQPLNAVEGTDYVEKRFIATSTGYGKEDVQIDIDSRLLQDKSLVVYEELYDHTGVCRATHQDLDDYSQTVKTNQPAIATDLYQKSDNKQVLQRYAEQHLIDKITYQNLCVRHDYELSGILMNKATGEVYINEVTGEPVTASYSFRPDSQDGSVDKLEYVFDSTLLAPDTELVSYVTLTQNLGALIDHCKLDDGRETVKVVTPTIKTNIYDPETGEQSFVACRDKLINDDITWTDLPKDRVVQVYGWLINYETGVPVNDGHLTENEAVDCVFSLVDALGGRMKMSNDEKHQSRWEVFFPKTTNKVDVEKLKKVDIEKLSHISFATNEIPISASSGVDSFLSTFNYGITPAQKAVAMNVVVSENTVVANHVDIEDKDEAIDILRSEIKTKLTSTNNDKSVDPSSETMLVDTVSYKNCIVGKEYELEGHLVKKSDGSIISTNRVKFIPDSVDGETSISFILDTNSLANTDIVAYEYLYLDSDLACMHEDINDADQTIHVNNIVESALKALGVKTGDDLAGLILLLLFVLLLGLVTICAVRRYRIDKRQEELEVSSMDSKKQDTQAEENELNFQEIKSEVIEEEIDFAALSKE